MQRIERLMLSSKHLRHSWQKFRETLIEPRPDETSINQVIHNTARPQAYFNTVEAGLRFPIYKAMPNLLVGIGLLLTFFGLVTALYFTNEAIKDANNLAASQDALRNLLSAASFKFYTSIAGLGGSILLTLVLRYGTSKIENSFDALALALERKVVLLTPEAIAYDQYREAQEQTKTLKVFSTEVAISVGKKIEQALAATLPAYLAQAMAPIGKSLDGVASKLTTMNEGAIGKLAGDFVDRLQGATGEQMNKLAETLGALRTSLDGINRRIDESGSGLAENVARSTQDMREAITAMTAALREVTTRTERGIEDGSTAMKRQIESAAATLDNSSRQISKVLNQATEAFQTASERTASRIEEAVTAITRGVLDQSAGIGERISQAAIGAGEESRSKIVGAGAELAQILSDVGQQLTVAVNRMQEGLNGTAREMANVEIRIAHHVGSLEQLSKATQETEAAIVGTTRSMREAGLPLAESSRLIAEASLRMSDATSGAERSIAGAKAEIHNISEMLRTTLEATVQQWQNYENRFKGVDESPGIVLDGIIKSVQDNLESLSKFVELVDQKLSAAVDRLGGGIDELGEFAHSMEEVTTRLNGRGNGHAPHAS
jgi:hypothetical protein